MAGTYDFDALEVDLTAGLTVDADGTDTSSIVDLEHVPCDARFFVGPTPAAASGAFRLQQSSSATFASDVQELGTITDVDGTAQVELSVPVYVSKRYVRVVATIGSDGDYSAAVITIRPHRFHQRLTTTGGAGTTGAVFVDEA